MTGYDRGFARRAVVRLSAIEFWERYAFYTMFALLALFAAAPVAQGGMGWSDGDSLRFFGLYLLIVQVAPLAGGWIADRWVRKRSLQLGGLFLLLGHALIAMPNLITWFATRATGLPMTALLAAEGAKLGEWTAPAALPGVLSVPYVTVSVCFYGSVLLVALGNGLFKPVLTVAVGRLPHPDEGERNAAFTTYFLFLNAGGLLSTLLGGWIAQRFGWGWAFAASSSGMGVSIATMFLLERRYIDPFLDAAPGRHGDATVADDGAAPRRAIVAILTLLAIFIVACAFTYQTYGFVTLFTAHSVDRHLGGMTIPPSWFIAINPITIIALSPVLAWLWRRHGPTGRWTAALQISAVFLTTAAGFALVAGAAARSATGGLASPGWIIGANMLTATAELLINPLSQSVVTRLAPARHQSLAMGALACAAGLGAGLSGRLGALALEGNTLNALLAMTAATTICGLAVLGARRVLARIGI